MGTFDSLSSLSESDMFQPEEARALMAHATAPQRAMEPGDPWFRLVADGDVTHALWGTLMDLEDAVAMNTPMTADIDVAALVRMRIEDAVDVGLRPAMVYGLAQPWGEYGLVHTTEMMPIAQSELHLARADGWDFETHVLREQMTSRWSDLVVSQWAEVAR